VVLPVLGTGAAGFDFAEGARFVCEAVAAFDPESLSDVRIIAYSAAEHERLSTVADEVRATERQSQE
jgi:O-acetyl-ADP-ribose deacetylase (regulator of RNase III)